MYRKESHFNSIVKNASWTRLSANAAQFETDGSKGIVYENTVVFLYDKSTRSVKLNSGGRKTMTTKKRINHGLSLIRSDYRLSQKNYNRTVSKGGQDPIEFVDNMQI